jgi:glyoxylase I family protein
MTRISGYHHVSLTVTDLDKSTEWYGEALGFSHDADIEGDGFRRTRLHHPSGTITLTLTQHENGSGDRFDERRTGLDHVAFSVPNLKEVREFKRRFEEQGVPHSEIKLVRSEFGDGGMITLRDPDNIQLEVFASGT